MAGTVYGYARVSTREQNLDRKLVALGEFGVERANIFADKASGKDFERPEWIRMKALLKAGDMLVVKSIDRFGRSYEEIIEQWCDITRTRGANVVVLDMPLLDTREDRGGVTGALISDIVLQLPSYVAQVEREGIRQRQREGIDAAKARAVRFGHPRKRRPGISRGMRESYLAGHITRSEAASRLKVSISTFDKWLRVDQARGCSRGVAEKRRKRRKTKLYTTIIKHTFSGALFSQVESGNSSCGAGVFLLAGDVGHV